MRILLIHSDYIEFEAKKKAVKSAEELDEKVHRAENVLIVFMAVEKPDEANPESVVEQLVANVKDTFAKVGAENIVLYPYAHLSSNLGSLQVAKKILDDAHAKLAEGHPTLKAPFGWYKSFELKCKGHPLSELSRTILPEVGLKEGAEEKEEVSEALKKEEKLESHWYVMKPSGDLVKVEDFDFKGYENLKKFSTYEIRKVRAVDQTPPHVRLMKALELVDYEAASDPGNMRYYPKGRLIKSLLEDYVTREVVDYGGVEVETPIMYDFEHPSLKKYLHKFPARQYTVESEKKKYFLRFSACFGQFLIAHDATISYKNLPLRLYELTRYSFRREKSGELTGLRRLRAFTMPDVHALCEDMKQAMQEYKRRFKLCKDVLYGIGFEKEDFELAVRVTKDFYEKNKDFVKFLVSSFGKPALIEMWDSRPFYFVLKYEFNFVDALDKASALATDQIDIENGERYDINFVTTEGSKKHPIILHCSPSGAIERVIYAMLERSEMHKKAGKVPQLPMWLCPTQVRLIPLSDNFKDLAAGLGEKLVAENVRFDIDDRSETISSKVRDAEKEWIPIILVVGDKEAKTDIFKPRIRGSKDQKEMKLADIIKLVKDETKDKPFKRLSLPTFVSERPRFV